MLDFLKHLFVPRKAAPMPLSFTYATPSINDEAGAISIDTATVDNRLIIEEDNWRFTEFVHRDYSALIDEEIEDIRTIHRDHKAAVGWSKVHVRSRISDPLGPSPIAAREFADLFPRRVEKSGVAYFNSDGVIDHGFAFSTAGGMSIYGQRADKSGTEAGEARLRLICCESCMPEHNDVLKQELDRMANFARQHQLYLVCWNLLQKLEADASSYLRLIERFSK